MSRDMRVPIEHAISMLEPTLGWDKSAELVEATAKELGLPAGNLDFSQLVRIFEALGTHSDLVGVAARFARTRLEGYASRVSSLPPDDDPEPLQDSTASGSASGPELPGRLIPITEVVDLFAPALGVEKSSSVVSAACSELGLAANKLEMRGALMIIDCLAKNEGLVGVVAQFAKAHLILKLTTEPGSETSPEPRTGSAANLGEHDDRVVVERFDQLAREAGISWVEWLQEDFAQQKAEPPKAFPETHHGARTWLMRALPRASREALKEHDLDRMVRILFESARREWEGSTSQRG